MSRQLNHYVQATIFVVLLSVFQINISSAQSSVIMQHNDLKRTGWISTETSLKQSNVKKATFGKLFSRTVDDQMYAQPLIVSNIAIGGKKHNVVFLATVNNSVYAFDAESDTAATPLWKVNLTPAGSRVVKNSDMTGACGGNYRHFSGNIGIVGTPALDTVAKTLYVVARSITTGGVFAQYLHAIDLTTGAEKPNSPVSITATISATGSGSVNGQMAFDEQKQNQRPALLLYNGVVYIEWASHCDWGPYHGWMMGYDATTLVQKYVYNDTPDGNLGGIWMSGQAPSVDDSGYLYITTGNGTEGRNGNARDTADRGESLLKMSVASGKLKVVDYFTPYNYAYLDQKDLDYGTDGALLIPNTTLSLSGSKASVLYLVNNSSMGGIVANNANVKEQINLNADDGSEHLHGSPVYFKSSTGKEYVYCWAEEGLMHQIPFIRAQQYLDTANTIYAPSALPTGMPGAMLSISSNGYVAGTGIIWASHPLSGNAFNNVVPGIIEAFSADNVSKLLWSSNQNKKRDSVGRFAKYVCPTVANGKVYLATFSNKLAVYGLLPANQMTADKTVSNSKPSLSTNIFIIVPNPAKNSVTIQYRSAVNQQASIELINTLGKTILQEQKTLSASLNTIVISFPAAVSNGVYILKITTQAGESLSKKLVIQK